MKCLIYQKTEDCVRPIACKECTDFGEPQPPVQSALIGLLGLLKSQLNAGAMACNSRNGDYSVVIKCGTLNEAQELHRALIELRKT